jgi:hypothetical protein
MEPPDPLHLDHIKASQGLKAVLALEQVVGLSSPNGLLKFTEFTFAAIRP